MDFNTPLLKKRKVTLELLAKINHMASRMKADPGRSNFGLFPWLDILSVLTELEEM